MTTPAELFAEVLAEQAAYDGFDLEMSPNPYDPWRAAEKMATQEAVPVLVEALARGAGVPLAAHALAKLGPAGRAASVALEKHGELLAVFCVDEPRARAIGLHVRADIVGHDQTVRSLIANLMCERADAASHFAELLRDRDEAVIRFALDVSNRRDRSFLLDLAQSAPSCVPVAEVRALLLRRELAAAASRILEAMHLPEDAVDVLAVRVRQQAARAAVDWLGPLPGSEALLGAVSVVDLFELVRRRRCPGLATDATVLIPRLLQALNPANDWRIIAAAARAVAELGLVELLDVVVDGLAGALTPEHHLDVSLTLAAFGNAGLAAVQRGLTRWVGDGRQRLERVAAGFAQGAPCGVSLTDGHVRFVAGILEATPLIDNAAYASYAATLLRDPRNAQAAFQCAWIDRGFGTPITHERIEWLRSLGVSDERLGALAQRPPAIVPGHRVTHRHQRANSELAEIGEHAGLFGVAANYAEGFERERLRERARAHVAQLG